MPTVVTGVAGFIGFHVCRELLQSGHRVVGIDNLSDYGGRALKEARISELKSEDGFEFYRLDICERERLLALLKEAPGINVIHLAAQPGVRHSITHPNDYVQSNLVGFANVLEGCRQARVRHLTFASSSSVYGANSKMPYSTSDTVDHPVSLYAATKKSNELMAHAYAHLHGVPCTGLRFFTVYGPWGRTDMAPYLFTRAILDGRPIDVYNEGRNRRDFTYVGDIVKGVLAVSARPAQPDPAWSGQHPDPASSAAPFRLYNIGNSRPVGLLEFISELERALGRTADKRLLPAQPGDVEATWADVEALERDTGYRPTTSLVDGIARYVEWFTSYYGEG